MSTIPTLYANDNGTYATYNYNGCRINVSLTGSSDLEVRLFTPYQVVKVTLPEEFEVDDVSEYDLAPSALPDVPSFIFHAESGSCFRVFLDGLHVNGDMLAIKVQGAESSEVVFLDLVELSSV